MALPSVSCGSAEVGEPGRAGGLTEDPSVPRILVVRRSDRRFCSRWSAPTRGHASPLGRGSAGSHVWGAERIFPAAARGYVARVGCNLTERQTYGAGLEWFNEACLTQISVQVVPALVTCSARWPNPQLSRVSGTATGSGRPGRGRGGPSRSPILNRRSPPASATGRPCHDLQFPQRR